MGTRRRACRSVSIANQRPIRGGGAAANPASSDWRLVLAAAPPPLIGRRLDGAAANPASAPMTSCANSWSLAKSEKM
ncbi:hypothetical protein NHX12_028470 [Muraenolepis orangiensis]|uniref:Uncharacterized protein n=1 Tax=Muraenolepis orangiensis TaxID=630683 RepID=A0A9Q0IM56_9TELE|nr:hypothetical protein NHX12_028470 [Muraenolepis orangiensis]